MTKTNLDLVEYVKKALDEGWKYWYGTTGQKCTNDLLNRKAAQYPAHYTSSRMATYRQHIAEGRMCADCVNLIKGFMWTGDDGIQRYASNGCPDTNADGMFKRAKIKGDIKDMPDNPGICVRFAGHVGVYIGDGYVVEERGFAYGCVRTKLTARPWTDWYEFPGVAYVTEPKVKTEEPVGDGDCPFTEPTTNVRYGQKGNKVKWVQWHLLQLDFDLGKSGMDGDFGKMTIQAVKRFQAVMGLVTDGIVGPDTRNALKSVLDTPEKAHDGGCPYPIPDEIVKRGMRNNKCVAWVQWHLVKLGYSIGPCGIDEDFGADTEKAVKAFQEKAGLEPTGVVAVSTRKIMLAEVRDLDG